jgi:hypothetical protein
MKAEGSRKLKILPHISTSPTNVVHDVNLSERGRRLRESHIGCQGGSGTRSRIERPPQCGLGKREVNSTFKSDRSSPGLCIIRAPSPWLRPASVRSLRTELWYLRDSEPLGGLPYFPCEDLSRLGHRGHRRSRAKPGDIGYQCLAFRIHSEAFRDTAAVLNFAGRNANIPSLASIVCHPKDRDGAGNRSKPWTSNAARPEPRGSGNAQKKL